MRFNSFGYTEDYESQCSAWTVNNLGIGRRQCGSPPVRNIGEWVYLCRRHYDLIYRTVEDEVDSRNERRIENLRDRAESAQAELDLYKRYDATHSIGDYSTRRRTQIVYFMRCEQFVKIGISANPAVRLSQIRKGGGSLFPKRLDIETTEIVATEPGGSAREKALHRQFAHLRHTGEWFTEAPELTEYINAIQAKSRSSHV